MPIQKQWFLANGASNKMRPDMKIDYKTQVMPPLDAILEVFCSSGINRPINDRSRIQQMFQSADLVITAWAGNLLVGIARSLTDFCYCCYLSDLAVRKEYQQMGIGKTLVQQTIEQVSDKTTLVLVAVWAAADFYAHIGMERIENGFIIKRKA
jgi:ribosomal protein S18 acetylase RimI-like enzyme